MASNQPLRQASSLLCSAPFHCNMLQVTIKNLTLGLLLLQQDHEKHVQRAKEVKQASTQAAAPQGSPAASPGQAPSTEAAALYKKQDLSLKEGQTIKCGTAHAQHICLAAHCRASLQKGRQTRLLCLCTAESSAQHHCPSLKQMMKPVSCSIQQCVCLR